MYSRHSAVARRAPHQRARRDGAVRGAEGVTDPVQSLPLYTNLFLRLGLVAVIGTVVAAALIPLLMSLPEADAIAVGRAPG
jgi:hypothetical protein